MAFAGFDPSRRVSADKVTSYIPIAGNKFIRRTFLRNGTERRRLEKSRGAWSQRRWALPRAGLVSRLARMP